MTGTIVLAGRPNVGKSTLFNRITRTRNALVADMPGLTRDRQYGRASLEGRYCVVVDTGGLGEEDGSRISAEVRKQALAALAEGDVIVFVVDGRAGRAPGDEAIARDIRRMDKPVVLVANKCEGVDTSIAVSDFHQLGFGRPIAISAAHGDGVGNLLAHLATGLPTDHDLASDLASTRVAIVGRPNVGKSTLINTLLGEERVIACDQAGTTRDSICVPFEFHGSRYELVDTAGLRRRGRVFESIEKFSVVKTLQSIEQADVVILVLDGTDNVSDQDAHIAGYVVDAGRALVVATNKWDLPDAHQKARYRESLERKLPFVAFSPKHFVSAKSGTGMVSLMGSVDRAHASASVKLSTPKLTRALATAIERQAPPRAGLHRPKMRYAHQGGSNPPVIVIHGTGLGGVPASYTRFLERYFADAFHLIGTPVRVRYKSATNPFAST